jgi:hypothetical protein
VLRFGNLGYKPLCRADRHGVEESCTAVRQTLSILRALRILRASSSLQPGSCFRLNPAQTSPEQNRKKDIDFPTLSFYPAKQSETARRFRS